MLSAGGESVHDGQASARGRESRFEVGLAFSFLRFSYAEDARLTEELDFDYLACGEHLAFHGPVPNAFILLSHVAAATKRIRLLSAITLAPLYPAVLLAKLAAMTDVVSGGRFELGVGVGGEYPAEFEACGVPIRERGARTDESLQVIRILWSGETVSYRGRFCSFTDLAIQPRPLRQPGPRIWAAGRGRAAIRRAALLGDVWMPYMYTPEQLGESVAELRAAAGTSGAEPREVSASINCYLAVDRDGRRARRTAEDCVSRIYQQDFTGSRSRYLVAGTPAECGERLREYAAAGAQSAILSLACPPEKWPGMARLVASELLPDLHSIGVTSLR